MNKELACIGIFKIDDKMRDLSRDFKNGYVLSIFKLGVVYKCML